MATSKVSKKKSAKVTDPEWRRKTWDDLTLTGSTIQSVAINDLILDDTVQTRAVIDSEAVSQFARDIAAGDTVPNLKVVSIPNPRPKEPPMMYVVDGFSRYNAYDLLSHDYNHKYIPEGKEMYDYQWPSCQILGLPEGTIEDVRRIAIGLNRKNGQSRSAADLKREIGIALGDPILKRMSSSELGRRIGCSHQTIEKYRKIWSAKKRTASGIEITGEEIAEIEIEEIEEDVRVGKDGRQFKAAKAKPEPVEEDELSGEEELDDAPSGNDYRKESVDEADEEDESVESSGNDYRKESMDEADEEDESVESSGNDCRKEQRNYAKSVSAISSSVMLIAETGDINNPATYATQVRDVLVTLADYLLRKNVANPTSEEITATAGIILEGARMLLYQED